jgi:MFS family permease
MAHPAASAAPALSPGARLWRNRDFLVFWSGQSLSNLGDSLAAVALPLLVLEATGSVVAMGLLTGTFATSSLITGLFSGAIVDRVDRWRLMIITDLLRMLLIGLIPLVWYLHGPVAWLLFGVAVVGGSLNNLFQVSYITAVASLVAKDELLEANGRLQSAQAATYVLGPALAGLLAARGGPALALAVDSATFLVSLVSLWSIRESRRVNPLALVVPPPPSPAAGAPSAGRKKRLLDEFLAGVRFIWQEPTLRTITLLLVGVATLMTGVIDLFIFRLKHDLGQGDRTVGFMMGVVTSGSVLGALVAGRLQYRFGLGPTWLGALLLQGLALVAMAFWPKMWPLTLMATLITFGTTIRGTLTVSFRQMVTPDHMLGRVTAAFWVVIAVPAPIGTAAFAALASKVGVPLVFGLLGGGAVVLFLLGLQSPLARPRVPPPPPPV